MKKKYVVFLSTTGKAEADFISVECSNLDVLLKRVVEWRELGYIPYDMVVDDGTKTF